MDRIDEKWPMDQQGVLITQAVQGGWAHIAGLRTSDLVLSLQDRAVADVKAFEKLMNEVMEKKPKLVKFFVRRGYRTAFVFIEPDWKQYEEEN